MNCTQTCAELSSIDALYWLKYICIVKSFALMFYCIFNIFWWNKLISIDIINETKNDEVGNTKFLHDIAKPASEMVDLCSELP